MDGRRRSLRLGKIDRKSALTVKWRVDCIVSAFALGVNVDDDTARWLADRDDTFRDKLVAVGLASARPKALLEPFLDGYLAMRSSAKPTTLTVWKQTRRYRIDFFGPSKPIRDITPGDAERWRIWLGERLNRRNLPLARDVRVARQLVADRPQALPSDHGKTLRKGAAKSGAPYSHT